MNVLQRTVQWLARAAMSPVWDNRGGWFPIIHEPYTGAWQRNQEWTTDTVLAHHAVYACITRIAQDIGKLRPKLVAQDMVWEKGDDEEPAHWQGSGIWSETRSPVFSRVLARPNSFQNYIQFQEWWTTSKLIRGNTYVLLERDAAQRVRAMYVLDPARVTVLVAPDGEVFYDLRTDHLSGLEMDRVAVPASEIVHDRINCIFHPLVGTSPIFACGAAANLGLHIERNSSSFFGNGSNPSGILTAPTALNPEDAQRLKQQWDAQYAGVNSGKVAVLGNGLKFEAMRMTAQDSQMIEQLRWTAETVCSAFHVPAWKLGVAAMPAYTSPAIANQTYYSDCLQSPIEQFELCMDEAFGFDTPTGGRMMGVELDLDGLLRMDKASHVDTLVKGVRGGVYTPNGARRQVDEPPLPGGDTIYLQHQDYPMEMIFNRTDLNPPPASAPAPLPPAKEPDPDDDAERAARIRTLDILHACTLEMEMEMIEA